MKLLLRFFLPIIFAFTCFSLNAQGEKYYWKKMKQQNTVKSYKSYTSMYPSGKFVDKAERKKNKLMRKAEKAESKSIKKHHKKIQDRKTLREMRKMKRRSERMKKKKNPDSFFEKIFTK